MPADAIGKIEKVEKGAMIRSFSVRQLVVFLSACLVIGWLALIVNLEQRLERTLALLSGLTLAVTIIGFRHLFPTSSNNSRIVLDGIVNESMWTRFQQQMQKQQQLSPASTMLAPLHVEINVRGHQGLKGWSIGLDICRELMKYPGALHAHVPCGARTIGTLMVLICDQVYLSDDATLSPCYTPENITSDSGASASVASESLFTAEQEDSFNVSWVQRTRPTTKMSAETRANESDSKTIDLSERQQLKTAESIARVIRSEDEMARIRYYFFNPRVFDSECVFDKETILSCGTNASNASTSSGNRQQQQLQLDYGSIV